MVLDNRICLESVAITESRRIAGAELNAADPRRVIAYFRGVAAVAGEQGICRRVAAADDPSNRPACAEQIIVMVAVETAGPAQQGLAAIFHDIVGAVLIAKLQGSPAAKQLQAGFVGDGLVRGICVDLDLEAVIQPVVRRARNLKLQFGLVDTEIPVMLLHAPHIGLAGQRSRRPVIETRRQAIGIQPYGVLVDPVGLEIRIAREMPDRRNAARLRPARHRHHAGQPGAGHQPCLHACLLPLLLCCTIV